MLTSKITKNGNMLDNIKASIKALHNSKVEVGYFASQGTHPTSNGYSYAALAQALELGLLAKGINVGIPMPFMKKIMLRSLSKIRTSSKVKRAFHSWGCRLHSNVSPEQLLDSIGQVVKYESTYVFNNTNYFPENPKNKTPLFETGEFASKFAYRTSTGRSVKS